MEDLGAEQLIEDIGSFAADPLGYALYAFPWGEPGPLEEMRGPRPWQASVMGLIGEHLRSPARFQPCEIAVSSGHGIGKSALIGQLIGWAMSTCEDCRVVVTANTDTQLRTKTWPEVSKWFRLAINASWWDVQAKSISVKEKGHEHTWRADAIPWSEHNTEAFAGLHNKGKRIVAIYDEASAIADRIWDVTEGALTDEDTEILWLAFGNPTKNTGRFRECFGRYKHRWKTLQIDSRRVEGTNKTQLDKWVQDYGEDSDFVRVRVRGEFPRAGATQFIAGDIVAEARKRTATGHERQWKVMAVDVARFGDDTTVIGVRQGEQFRVLDRLRGLDVVQVAGRVMERMRLEDPRAVVIDGDGIGGGVVDVVKDRMPAWIRTQGKSLVEFHGGMEPRDTFMYFNRRAEVWGLMREWLKTGDIPDDPEIETDLTAPQYFFSAKNQIQLERKEEMKKRGLASPDLGDTLAMTFSVMPQEKTREERLEEAIEAAPTEQQRHFMRLAETERRQRAAKSSRNWWET